MGSPVPSRPAAGFSSGGTRRDRPARDAVLKLAVQSRTAKSVSLRGLFRGTSQKTPYKLLQAAYASTCTVRAARILAGSCPICFYLHKHTYQHRVITSAEPPNINMNHCCFSLYHFIQNINMIDHRICKQVMDTRYAEPPNINMLAQSVMLCLLLTGYNLLLYAYIILLDYLS